MVPLFNLFPFFLQILDLLLQIDKVVKSWTPVTALKMSYFVTCVKHLFLHFTLTSATLTSVRPGGGGHILDDSKLHIVVSVKNRQSPLVYSKCPEHTSKLCELHCEQCDIPICVQYVFSKKHKAHDVVDILHFSERKNKALQAGLEELGKKIYPRYQEIASTILDQKADLKSNTEQLITALNKRRCDWQREIDDVISKLKIDIKIQNPII